MSVFGSPVGHLVTDVLHQSPAARMGIRPGDVLCAINDHPIADCIDYLYHAAEFPLELTWRRGEKLYAKRCKTPCNGNLGLIFETDLMDDPKRCANRCVFCFVDQQPPGLRPILALKDDDWRLSFLMGTYVTLTNLQEADWQRILTQKPSPLHVSVHATDPQMRVRLLGNPKAGPIFDQLHTLAAAGITLHTQAVICPGLNDGAVLQKTIDDLLLLYPHVQSLAVVPVGLTAHRKAPLDGVTPEHARSTLALIHAAQERVAKKHGVRFVHAADEFYLLAGLPIPPLESYDGAPQYEDGVGLTATMYREFLDALPDIHPQPGKQTLATGRLAAPLIAEWVAHLPQSFPATQLVEVCNQTMGHAVTVAGLLTGKDVLAALQGLALGQRLLLPGVMFNDQGLTLDNMTLSELQTALNIPICLVPNEGGTLAAALAMADCHKHES